MLKKYLERKENAQLKELKQLPKLDHSVSISNCSKTNQTSSYLRPQKQISTRICTEYEEDRLKPMRLKDF